MCQNDNMMLFFLNVTDWSLNRYPKKALLAVASRALRIGEYLSLSQMIGSPA